MTDSARRRISVTAATALVVANMIGAGIFTTTGFLSQRLGSPWLVLGVWVVGGVLALCGATVYAELGAMMPRVGGEYVYLSRGLHPSVGFLSGWVSLLVGFSAPVALSAHAFGAYIHAVEPAVPVKLAGGVLIVAVTALHAADVVWGARAQTLLTIYKVALIAVFAVAAFTVGSGDWRHLDMTFGDPGGRDLAIALVIVSSAYLGWNAAAYVAGELRDPRRALPRALLGGTALVVVLYLALNLALFYAAPAAELAGAPEAVGHVAALALFGTAAGDAFSLLIGLALVSSVSAMAMAGPRVYVAMAEDGLFFRGMARRNRTGAPWVSVAVQGALALAMLATSTFLDLLTYVGFTLSGFSALAIVAAFALRWREPDAPRPYRAFAWPLSGALFLALSAWMVTLAIVDRPAVALAGGATLAAGGAAYLWFRRPEHPR
jgi:APA family basic amino acid/polyamine antiporter